MTTISDKQKMRAYEDAASIYATMMFNKEQGDGEYRRFTFQYKSVLEVFKSLGLFDDYAEWHDAHIEDYRL